MNYFDKIPTITYDGHVSKNLLARARLSDSIKKQKTAFYPFVMNHNDRTDTVSDDYYGSPGYTWLIWMTNNIVDPYYGTPLSDAELNEHIKKKYGSYEKASRSVKCYRNNWYDNTDDHLSEAQYEAMTDTFKKYYDPVLDNYLNIRGYKRKRDDNIVSTNKIITLTLTGATGTFTVGEEVQTNGTNFGFITFANTTVATVNHVTGTLSGTITGQDSSVTATVSTSTLVYESVASTESTYWSPVSYLEFEEEVNEMRKTIKLLDKRFANQADNDLRRIMSIK